MVTWSCRQTSRHHLTNISGNTDLCVRPSSHFLSVGLQASPCPLSWEHPRGQLWAAEWAEEGSNPRLTLGLGIHLWGPLFLLEMRKMAAPLRVTVKRVTTKVWSRCPACGNCSGIPGRKGGVGRRQRVLSGCSGLDPDPSAAILPVGLSGMSQEMMTGPGSSGKREALQIIPVWGLGIFQGTSQQLAVLRYGLPVIPGLFLKEEESHPITASRPSHAGAPAQEDVAVTRDFGLVLWRL